MQQLVVVDKQADASVQELDAVYVAEDSAATIELASGGRITIDERSLVISERVYGSDHPNVARGLNNLAGVLQDLGELVQARSHYERALEIVSKRLGDEHPNTQIVRENLNRLLEAMQ